MDKKKLGNKEESRKYFLQSKKWRDFQLIVGNETFELEDDSFQASIIKHNLPIVGSYFYIPRGLFFKNRNKINKESLGRIIQLAKKNKASWIRVDFLEKKDLLIFKKNIDQKIVNSPHDMQPREIFKINISKNEEELLVDMKAKTRYNIRLAKKKGVKIKVYSTENSNFDKVLNTFFDMLNETTKRKGITAHSNDYYRKMFNSLSSENIKLYVAKYKNEIIAANINIFFGDTVTYLHGATSDRYRNVMAPFLLQWEAILDAKNKKFHFYDFGGVKTSDKSGSWSGITRFKMGFSKNQESQKFIGSYDIILRNYYYVIYNILRHLK
jgi:lipid II:glycine glycyltransferase (peptidoglycan interpeptide bridge formation enzyme)